MGSELEPKSSVDGAEIFKDANSDSSCSGNYECVHYKRKCKIRAPCCDEIFDCRHCHNEAKNSLNIDPRLRHDLPRHEVELVICSICGAEQDVQQNCQNCGICMGKYFCQKCKFFDDDVSKQQYHCDECGICRTGKPCNKCDCLCRTGGKENFFHCNKCGCCYSKSIKDSHHCIDRAMHHNCPVCFEFLFDSVKDITVLQCGHTMHVHCVKEMELRNRFTCPVCSKSICDLSNVWEKLDQEIASTPMPEGYKNKMVWILCNDCGEKTEVNFHILAHKCLRCKSYNTRQIQGIEASSARNRVAEIVR